MGRYVIERTLPGAGKLSEQELAGVAAKSNEVLADEAVVDLIRKQVVLQHNSLSMRSDPKPLTDRM